MAYDDAYISSNCRLLTNNIAKLKWEIAFYRIQTIDTIDTLIMWFFPFLFYFVCRFFFGIFFVCMRMAARVYILYVLGQYQLLYLGIVIHNFFCFFVFCSGSAVVATSHYRPCAFLSIVIFPDLQWCYYYYYEKHINNWPYIRFGVPVEPSTGWAMCTHSAHYVLWMCTWCQYTDVKISNTERRRVKECKRIKLWMKTRKNHSEMEWDRARWFSFEKCFW